MTQSRIAYTAEKLPYWAKSAMQRRCSGIQRLNDSFTAGFADGSFAWKSSIKRLNDQEVCRLLQAFRMLSEIFHNDPNHLVCSQILW